MLAIADWLPVLAQNLVDVYVTFITFGKTLKCRYVRNWAGYKKPFGAKVGVIIIN